MFNVCEDGDIYYLKFRLIFYNSFNILIFFFKKRENRKIF